MGNSRYQSFCFDLICTYFRLICDSSQDKDVERLLRYCLTPPLSSEHLQALQAQACIHGQTLMDIVSNHTVLQQCDLSPEQYETVYRHIAVVNAFKPESTIEEVWAAISSLPSSFIEKLKNQEQKLKEIEEAIISLKAMTVKMAMREIATHITFLPKSPNWKLVVTTIDYAKSQEFDTVFLIGADWLKQKERWYVSVTRARDRFFALIDEHYDKNHPILTTIKNSHTTTTRYWSKDQGCFYEPKDQAAINVQGSSLDDLEHPF